MRDLIDRQAAIDALNHMCSEDEKGITVSRANVNSMLRALPSAQSTEASCWGCNCPKMERLKEQKTFSEMVHLHDAVEAIEGLPPAQPKPCEDAVSRTDVLECFADLYDTFEDCSKGIINELHRKFEDLRTLPSAQPDRSLWFRIGEICVDESKGIISADRAVEKIRELLREAERREDG